MKKKYYDLHKELRICTHCGKNKAEPNKILCLECAAKDSEATKKYNKERKAKYAKRKRELCDAFGVCTTCMKRDKYKGKQCMECYLKRNRKYKEELLDAGAIPRDLWKEFELCSICGKPRHKSSKLCKKHLETARNNATTARKFIDRENHKWRKDKHMEIMRIQSIHNNTN